MRIWALLLCGLSACSLQPRDQQQLMTDPPFVDGGVDSGTPAAGDRDGDGLCDATEDEFGTRSDALDTDDDGYPDLIEVINSFDPLDPENPGLDQVGFLVADRGASYTFETRLTVDGEGEGYTGLFAAYPSINADRLNAEDFLGSGAAVSAEPPDNVRDIDPSGEHFGSVLGHTRLIFELRFEYTQAKEAFECAESFAFSYGVKNDLGDRTDVRDYMLVVTPAGSSGLDAMGFCLPAACL